ncbi:MAG: hypothetical protein LC650_01040 [Actinobacteria bacterium]|nr:hypothetical protein [Actinomycetota bacterium]
MQFTTVEIDAGFTQNIGNYESLRTDVRIGAKLEPGEPLEEVISAVYEKVQEALVDKAIEFRAELSGEAKRKTGINPTR